MKRSKHFPFSLDYILTLLGGNNFIDVGESWDFKGLNFESRLIKDKIEPHFYFYILYLAKVTHRAKVSKKESNKKNHVIK